MNYELGTMKASSDNPRRGINPAFKALGAIGIMACACSLYFASGPTLQRSSAQGDPEGQQSFSVLSSGLIDLLRQKLVDPDAQSDELEHPAILLDPNSLPWDNNSKAVNNALEKKGDQVLDWSQGKPFEDNVEDGEEKKSQVEEEKSQAERNEEKASARARREARRARRASSQTGHRYIEESESAKDEVQDDAQSQDPGKEVAKDKSKEAGCCKLQDGQAVLAEDVQEVVQNETLSQPEVELTRNMDSESVKKFGKCALTQKLLDYTIQRIRNAELHLDPYPHLYLTRVFEPSFYQNCLLARLPPTAAYEQLPNNRDRNQIPISGKFGHGPQAMDRVGRPKGKLSGAKAKLMDVQFWTEFGRLFANKQLGQTWLQKFYPTLQYRKIEDRINNWGSQYWYTMSLGRDLKGYNIGPHTDTADKWVTTLFYLPKDDKNPNLGTAVVRSPTGKLARGNYRGKLDGDDFVIAKKAGFVRNTVMAFASCEKSWHAVQKVEGSIQRDTLQGFVSGQIAGGKKTGGGPGSPLKPSSGWNIVK